MVKGARKPFDWGKLYLPLGCLFLILTPFYITLFMYSWIDSIWPFRACPGYWAFCVLVQFIIFTLVPFLTFGILGVYLCQKPRFAKVSDVNAVQSAANPVFYIKAVLYILIFLVLIFFLACLVTLTILVAIYHGTTIPQQNSDVSGLSGVQAATGILLVRDPNSVLHVQASNTLDVAYGLGFAHSQDRFYQMDLYRRIAMGWLAEIDTQPSALQSDKFFRTIGLNQTATDNYSLLSLDAKNWLLAYARGVNDYIGTKAAYPFEFYIKQYNGFARPWQPIHSLAILKLVQFLWSGNANQELLRTYLLFDQQLSFDRISELLPPYPIDGFSTFNPTDLDIPSALVQTYIAREKTRIAGEGTIVNALQSSFSVTPKASPPTTAAGITQRSLEELVSLWDGSVGAVRDIASMVSNAAATATFILHGSSISPMMGTSAQDSHKLMAPTLYYMANLKRVAQLSTDTNDEAIGATIPGIPGMFMGRALSYVYSVAPMYADTMDWFVMQETSDKMTYITNAGVQNYTRRTEVINVLNGAPVTITVRTSEFGPIMSDVFQTPINANTQQLSLALQWTGHYKTSTVADNTIEWLMKSWTAKTTSDTSLVATFSNYTSTYLNVPAMNVFYADRIDGVGRYVGAGRIPSRTTGHTGMFPVKGDRSIQWTGFHPNPVSSIRLILKPIIANAGNRPIGPGYPTNFGYDFADQYRGRRLYTYFNTITSSGRTVTTDNGISAVHDKYTSLLDDFKPLITSIRAASFVDSDASNALQNVFNWDGLDQNMATLFQNWYWELSRLSQVETGIQYLNRPEFILNAMLPNRTSLTNNTDVTATISGDTQTRNIGLCKLALATLYPSATVPDGQSACTMFALQAFKRAKDRVGTGTYWGNVKSTTFPHYGFHGSPMECTSSRYANRAGNQFTINQGAEMPPSGNFASTSGPLYRQFVDYSATGGAVYKWCTPMGSNANLWTKAMYDQYQGYWETETILPMQVSTEFSTSMYQTLRSQSA